MSAACAQKARVIKTENYHYAIAHDPFVNGPNGKLTQTACTPCFFIFRQRIADLNSAHAHANAMSLSRAHQARRFKALRCAGAARLSHKYEFDAFGCRGMYDRRRGPQGPRTIGPLFAAVRSLGCHHCRSVPGTSRAALDRLRRRATSEVSA